MNKKTGLGKGLSALIPDSSSGVQQRTTIDELENGLQSFRTEGDGTEWLVEADENGKVFKRAIGSDEKIYINADDKE